MCVRDVCALSTRKNEQIIEKTTKYMLRFYVLSIVRWNGSPYTRNRGNRTCHTECTHNMAAQSIRSIRFPSMLPYCLYIYWNHVSAFSSLFFLFSSSSYFVWIIRKYRCILNGSLADLHISIFKRFSHYSNFCFIATSTWRFLPLCSFSYTMIYVYIYYTHR